MNLLARARVERAVLSYDLWLDLRGAPGPRRRDLRRELRANLTEATAHIGARAAVERLGSTRAMAAEAVPVREDRPRWSVGLIAGTVAFAVVVLVELLSALAWSDGAMAAAPESTTSGSLTFFPGSALEYAPVDAGFALTLGFGWLAPALAVVTYLAVARPWRLVRARQPQSEPVA